MKVVVIVDMQNDFVTGKLGTPEARDMVETMKNRIYELSNDTLVIFTKDTHNDFYLETQEGKNLPISHCIRGTLGWSIVKPISSIVDYGKNFMKVSTQEIINSRILKDTFGSLDLAELLRDFSKEYKIEEVTLMGVCTDICVISNALLLKTYLPETLITVDASCCAGTCPAKHAMALEVMKSCQVNVINE